MMDCCIKNLLEMDMYIINSLGFCHMPVINLCAYAGLSLRATEGPWIVPCYYKHDPSYSHWKQKENRTNSISLESNKKKSREIGTN